MFQAVAEDAVEIGVTEEKLRRRCVELVETSEMIIDSGSVIYQPRRGVIGLAQIKPSFQDWETRLRKILMSI